MNRFNSDVVFIDGSGQVRVLQGDLTLRANPLGTGDVIVGSGEALRPEVDYDALDAMDLGKSYLRWKTLFAGSGNFIHRPTAGGSGVMLQGEAVDSLNGLLGDVNLLSVNDAIDVSVNGQDIELSGMFTSESGVLLDTVSDLVASDVVNRLNGLSGLVEIVGYSGINVQASGQNTILLTPASFSGMHVAAYAEKEAQQSTNSTSYVEALTLEPFALQEGTYRIGWSFLGSASKEGIEMSYRVQVDDTTDLMVKDHLFQKEVGQNQVQVCGFRYLRLTAGLHFVDVDFLSTNASHTNQIQNARLELWRVN